MRLFILLLITLTLSLQADPSLKSNIVLENESYTLEHESTYGITNNYSLVSIEHHIKAANSLTFYYGTCLGFVTEDYTADNGFGPEAEEFGLVMETSIGIDYNFENYQSISLEGSHSQNKMLHDNENSTQVKYQYKF